MFLYLELHVPAHKYVFLSLDMVDFISLSAVRTVLLYVSFKFISDLIYMIDL